MENLDTGIYCDFDDYDWSKDTLLTVMDNAKKGVPSAIKELKRREKELGLPIIDTVSGEAQPQGEQ